MKQNFALKCYFNQNPETIPTDLSTVAERYHASLTDVMTEDDGRYFVMAKLVKPTALDSMNFLRDMGSVKGVNTVIGGSYTPGLVERVIDCFGRK